VDVLARAIRDLEVWNQVMCLQHVPFSCGQLYAQRSRGIGHGRATPGVHEGGSLAGKESLSTSSMQVDEFR
jgi:hypothetical protein